MNNKNRYYITIRGCKQPDTVSISAIDIDIFDVSITGIEVYSTPFDSIKALHEKERISPVETIVVYDTYISSNDITTIDRSGEYHIYATTNLTLNKVQDMVLGSLVSYL